MLFNSIRVHNNLTIYLNVTILFDSALKQCGAWFHKSSEVQGGFWHIRVGRMFSKVW